ncbi:hypothetical protein ID866_10469 [Astraeus odoratus]|nr:hypothetical protein ID866_10469 [Astraeus odoratus]
MEAQQGHEQPNFNRLLQILMRHLEYNPDQAVRAMQQDWEHQQRERGVQQQGENAGQQDRNAAQPDGDAAQQEGNPEMLVFNLNQPVASALQKWPSEYAIKCLDAFKYVPLWYFTIEGLADVAKIMQQDDAKESLTLTQEAEGSLALRPTLSVTASKHARYDHNLSFTKFLYAKNMFLTHISRCLQLVLLQPRDASPKAGRRRQRKDTPPLHKQSSGKLA